jgi:hypothetical protein
MGNSYCEDQVAIADFFEWAEQQGYSIYDVARSLKLHFTTIYRIRRGQYVGRAGENFAIRAIAAYGDPVRPFFSDVLTVTKNTHDTPTER